MEYIERGGLFLFDIRFSPTYITLFVTVLGLVMGPYVQHETEGYNMVIYDTRAVS